MLVSLFNTRLKLLETYLGEQDCADCRQVIADLRGMVERIPAQVFYGQTRPARDRRSLDGGLLVLPGALQAGFSAHESGPAAAPGPGRGRTRRDLYQQDRTPQAQPAPGQRPAAAGTVHPRRRGLTARICAERQRPGRGAAALHPRKPAPCPSARAQPGARPVGRAHEEQAPPEHLLDPRPGGCDRSERLHHADRQRRTGVRHRIPAAGGSRILHIVENHPTLQAIGRGQPVDELQLLALERTLQQELAGGDLEVTPANLRKVYGVHIESFLDLLRLVLDMDAIPGYEQIVAGQFRAFITQHNYNADQIRFLRAVQSVFLQKRKLALADLYLEPLTNFGEDAVDRWFSPLEVKEMLAFTDKLSL